MAAPQYAMEHPGSLFKTSWNRSSARGYQKLCNSASARSKSWATEGEQEISMCTCPKPSSDREAGACSERSFDAMASARELARSSRKMKSFDLIESAYFASLGIPLVKRA